MSPNFNNETVVVAQYGSSCVEWNDTQMIGKKPPVAVISLPILVELNGCQRSAKRPSCIIPVWVARAR